MTEANAGTGNGTAPGATTPAPRKRTPWLMIVPIAIFVVLGVIFFIQLRFGDMSDTVQSALIGQPAPMDQLPQLEGLTANGAQLPGFSGASFRGPGLDDGLRILEKVRAETGLPVLTDVHDVDQVRAAAQVVDVLQTPAFLARQTDLIEAVGASGRVANIKKAVG